MPLFDLVPLTTKMHEWYLRLLDELRGITAHLDELVAIAKDMRDAKRGKITKGK